MTAGEDLDTCYAEASRIVRVETLPVYLTSDEAARIQAWRDGTPRPVRSVRTSEYLAEVARTTLTPPGTLWQRLRVMDPMDPTWYQRYEMVGYVESQAAGEEVFIVAPFAGVFLSGEMGTAEFTLFDEAAANLLFFDSDGRLTGNRITRDPAEVAACVAVRDKALARAIPLNTYLANRARAPRVA